MVAPAGAAPAERDQAPAKPVDAVRHATADVGSIPTVSTGWSGHRRHARQAVAVTRSRQTKPCPPSPSLRSAALGRPGDGLRGRRPPSARGDPPAGSRGDTVAIVRSMYAAFSGLAQGGDIAGYVAEHYEPDVAIRAAWRKRAPSAWARRVSSAGSSAGSRRGTRPGTRSTRSSRSARWSSPRSGPMAAVASAGSEISQRAFDVFELRGGRIVRLREYLDPHQALESCRLSLRPLRRPRARSRWQQRRGGQPQPPGDGVAVGFGSPVRLAAARPARRSPRCRSGRRGPARASHAGIRTTAAEGSRRRARGRFATLPCGATGCEAPSSRPGARSRGGRERRRSGPRRPVPGGSSAPRRPNARAIRDGRRRT